MRAKLAASAAVYIACIPLANLLVARFGAVPVWPGLVAPAGVYAVGVAFIARDFLQRSAEQMFGKGRGRWVTVGAVAVGLGLSYLLASPVLATASAAAFAVSELSDLAVFTALEGRGFLRALTLSNVVSAVLDSVVFLWLAFHSLQYLPGQLVGKLLMTVAALAVLVPLRLRRTHAA
jgi:uncharacterized PurR-regulated membrane protein YhhQ (DUF165 family)